MKHGFFQLSSFKPCQVVANAGNTVEVESNSNKVADPAKGRARAKI